ncbi:hypothetical protein FKM82_030478 [Ascaphus truei]
MIINGAGKMAASCTGAEREGPLSATELLPEVPPPKCLSWRCASDYGAVIDRSRRLFASPRPPAPISCLSRVSGVFQPSLIIDAHSNSNNRERKKRRFSAGRSTLQ